MKTVCLSVPCLISNVSRSCCCCWWWGWGSWGTWALTTPTGPTPPTGVDTAPTEVAIVAMEEGTVGMGEDTTTMGEDMEDMEDTVELLPPDSPTAGATLASLSLLTGDVSYTSTKLSSFRLKTFDEKFE